MKYLIPSILLIFLLYKFDGFVHLMEEDLSKNLIYSSNVNVFNVVKEILEGKYYTPTNTYKFSFQFNNSSDICKNPIKLTFLIKTATKHFARRSVIRQTWGSSKIFKDVRIVFLVGEKDKDDLNLGKEFEMFHDIVQGNFSDTNYYNLTLKTLMGLQWANEFCLENTEFFMFVNDDYYVSTKNVLKFIENPFLYPNIDNNKKINPDTFSLYAGNIFVGKNPYRGYFDKWYVSLNDYPYDKYPPYAGSTYILSRKTIRRMYYASLFLKPIRLEDVYIGILAYYLKIRPISNEKYVITNNDRKYNFWEYREILASSGFGNPDKMWNIWNEQTIADETKIFI